ncbi:c-type cytochrome [Colwellia sp. MEBiC06753]
MTFRQYLLSFSVIFTTVLAGSNLSANANEVPASYQTCVACHGDQGQGNPALNAPVIAGQHAWYTQRQLLHFITGVRGSHQQDVNGQQMRAIASQLEPNKDVPALAEYISGLTGKADNSTQKGDAKNGYRYYQAKCGACHGGAAEGNKSFNAPKLAGQDADYLKRQMANFVAGVRGSHAEDKFGKQMSMMARIVNEKDLNDIIYFISQQ